jgi:hypothetical protein
VDTLGLGARTFLDSSLDSLCLEVPEATCPSPGNSHQNIIGLLDLEQFAILEMLQDKLL